MMKFWMFFLAVVIGLPGHTQENEKGSNKIQIALLLDTSNSMDGLIEQAKGKLWSIVNEFARYRKGDTPPSLEIGLFEYGNDGLPQHDEWIRQISAFTADLDFISQQLFELTTYGGSEFCGQVIHESLHHLEWSRRSDDLKMIFIAGNERFDQGHFSFRDACADARGRDISVNTIYCGDYEQGVRELWKEGAMCSSGKYIHIDHNEKVTYIETPYDDRLEKLNGDLNDTYIGYGQKAREKKQNQLEQDDNAASYSRSYAAERAVSKALGYYSNADWDLVDAWEDGGESLEGVELEPSTLPADLKGKSRSEIERKVAEASQKRAAIKAEIQKVNRQRTEYISQQASGSENTLDQAIMKAVEALATEKGYRRTNP